MDIREIVAARMGDNFTKMDMALWERDAARGGVDYANRRAEEEFDKIAEIRKAAAERISIEENRTANIVL